MAHRWAQNALVGEPCRPGLAIPIERLAIPIATGGDSLGDWDRHAPSVESPVIVTGIAKHPWVNSQ
jgi:hypothetical protein